jgi:hypothetical protein
MKIEEGDEIVFNNKWWIVSELYPNYDGVAAYDECLIMDEDGEERIILANCIDAVCTTTSA